MALSDEIIAGPIAAYVAPKATAFPDVSEAPAVAWILLGAQGAKNITEDGVHIFLEDEKELWRGLGSTAPQKAFRTSEGARVEFVVASHELEVLDKARGGAATAAGGVTTTAAGAGTAGIKALTLLKGFTLTEVALLLRKTGDSPYGPSFNLQWEIPRCVANGNPEIVYVKNEPVGVQFSFELLEDPTSGFGRIVAQTAAPV